MVSSVWSGSALSTYVFIYSHALNFYLIIKKQLWISGHPVWNFPTCSCRMVEKSSNCMSAAGPGWCSLAPWHGWQYPPQPGGSCPGTHVLNLPQCGWEVTGALGKGEGTRIRHSERGLVSSGVEEAAGKGLELLTSDGVSICICIYSYICSMQNLARSNRASLNCRKIARCSNLPC